MNSASKSSTQFDFGENWDDFSRKALNRENIRQAKEDFQRLLDGIPLENRSFLDIGFGQGLSLLLASSGGARCLGIDINTRCLRVLSENGKTFFPDIPSEQIGRLQGSILDPALIRKLQLDSRAKEGKFDIVHSWGVLRPAPHRLDVRSDPKLGLSGFRAGLPGTGHLSDSLVERAMEMHQISIQ